MIFIIKTILQSANIFIILIIVTAVLYYLKRWKWSFRILIIALVWMMICLTRFIPEALLKGLESKFEIFDPRNHPEIKDSVHIHVLGGGHIRDARLPALAQLSHGSLSRLAEGIRISNLYPHSKLIVSGYSINGDESHAEILRRAAMEMGSQSDSIIVLSEPSNTNEESIALAKILTPDSPFVLVTSASHMKRAHYLFSKKGLQPIAAPADFHVKKSAGGRNCFFCVNPVNMSIMDRWIYEKVGLWKEKISN